ADHRAGATTSRQCSLPKRCEPPRRWPYNGGRSPQTPDPPSSGSPLYSTLCLSLFRFMCYTVPSSTGGTHYGRFTVCRCAVSPDGVSGFHQPDPGGVSDPEPAL